MFPQLEDLDPTDDVLFKLIFGSNERKHITIDFLNALFEREGAEIIKDIELPNVEFTPQHEGEKFVRVDIFATTQNNKRINIEMQRSNNHNMEKRTLYYWAQMFLNLPRLPSGHDYSELQPAITVNILNFKFLPSTEPYSRYSIFNAKNMHKLTDALDIYFLEVPKFAKKAFNEMSRFERWLAFFSNKFSKAEKEAMAVAESAIQDAVETANNFLMDEKEYWAYLNRQSAVRDYNSAINGARNEGLAKGLAKGLAEGLAEGEDKMLRLAHELTKAGRTDDLNKILADKSLLPEFYQEFGIQ